MGDNTLDRIFIACRSVNLFMGRGEDGKTKYRRTPSLDRNDSCYLAVQGAGFVDALDETCNDLEGIFADDLPVEAGLWVWEGACDECELAGDWRRPTSEELASVSQGKNPWTGGDL